MNIRSLIIFSVVSLSASIALAEINDKKIVENFYQNQVKLNQRLTEFCTNSKQNFPLDTWQQTVISWYLVQGLQLTSTEFMQAGFTHVFWPDPKDRLRNQVNQVLQQAPNTDNWKQLPVSTKSLSAIEYISTLDQPRMHCDWLNAISKYQVEQSQQLSELQQFYEFETFEQINALNGTTMVARSQLNEITSRADRLIWQLAPAWRSNSGWPIQSALKSQIETLLAQFEDADATITPWLNRLEKLPLGKEAPSVDVIHQYQQYLAELTEYIEHTLAPNLDIYLGFNNFDGD